MPGPPARAGGAAGLPGMPGHSRKARQGQGIAPGHTSSGERSGGEQPPLDVTQPGPHSMQMPPKQQVEGREAAGAAGEGRLLLRGGRRTFACLLRLPAVSPSVYKLLGRVGAQ